MPINLGIDAKPTFGAMPDLRAAPIGDLMSAILRDRLLRQKMTQENIADTIKNVRDERQGNALLDAMKAQGLVPEGYDAGGIGGAKLGTGLAKMIQDRKEADALEAYRNAQLGISQGHLSVAQQREQYLEDSGGGSNGDTPADNEAPETYTNEDGTVYIKRYDAKGRVNWVKVSGPTKAPKEQTQASLKTELANTGLTGPDIANPQSQFGTLPSGERVPADRPWTDASTIHVTPSGGTEVPLTIEKFRRLKKALGYPDPDPTPSGTPQPSPAQTGNVLSTSRPQPTATPIPPGEGADKNLAPGYGVSTTGVASSRDKAGAGQKYYAPDGTIRIRGDD